MPRLGIGCTVSAAALIVLAAPMKSAAGAWPQKPQSTEIITELAFTQATGRFDGGSLDTEAVAFDQMVTSVFLQRGLTTRWTLVASGDLARSDLSDRFGTSSGTGGRGLFGARYTLRHDRRGVLSFQALAGAAGGFGGGRDPIAGATGAELDLRILAGLSLEPYLPQGFTDLQAGYRGRFGDGASEAHLDATIGFGLWGSTQVFVQSFNVISVESADPPFEEIRRHTLSGSLVTPVLPRFTAGRIKWQGGVRYAVAGRTALADTTVFTALWLGF